MCVPINLTKEARQKSVQQSQEDFAYWQRRERNDFLKGKIPWSNYDERDYEISPTFAPVLHLLEGLTKEPDGTILQTYLGQRFTGRLGTLVGLALGGPERRFFGLEENSSPPRVGEFFNKSFAVTAVNPDLIKDRIIKTKYPLRLIPGQDPIPKNHTILESNIAQRGTYEQLQELLQGEKVDFVIERMKGGLKYLPKDPYWLTTVVKYIYDNVLSNDSSMLLEVPRDTFAQFMQKWLEKINSIPGIRVIYVDLPDLSRPNTGILLLERRPYAPDTLPILSIKELQEIDPHLR